MEEWADRTSTCLGCTPGFPSAPHTPCGGHARDALKVTGCRAHLQWRLLFGDFVVAFDRGDGKRTEGEHSRAARRELRREPLRRAARRNEGRGIRDSAREEDGSQKHEKCGRATVARCVG